MRMSINLKNDLSKPTIFVVLCATFCAGHAQAQAPNQASNQVSSAETIVVIGLRDGLLKISGAGATIEQADVTRARVFTVNEALRQVPGIFARDEEGLGLRPNIGIRGLSPIRSTKVLLLEDGLPLGYAPYGDNAAYFRPSIRRFARIEVLKGASQVRFGPNTVGGVINYVTPRAPDRFEGQLTLSGDSRGNGEVDRARGILPGSPRLVQRGISAAF